MIPAKKSPLFARWFSKQVEKRIRQMFWKVHVRGLDTLEKAVNSGPVVVVSNHTAWWDPMVSILIGHKLIACNPYALMDAKNLLRLPFLGRIGGFGVHLDDPADGKRVLRYAKALLERPGDLVWIYPQGRERPRKAALDDFRPGAAVLAKWVPSAVVVPIGVRYEFRNGPNPEAFIAIGTPLACDAEVERAVQSQQQAVAGALDVIDRHLMSEGGDDGFRVVLEQSRRPVEQLMERVLSFLTRY